MKQKEREKTKAKKMHNYHAI